MPLGGSTNPQRCAEADTVPEWFHKICAPGERKCFLPLVMSLEIWFIVIDGFVGLFVSAWHHSIAGFFVCPVLHVACAFGDVLRCEFGLGR